MSSHWKSAILAWRSATPPTLTARCQLRVGCASDSQNRDRLAAFHASRRFVNRFWVPLETCLNALLVQFQSGTGNFMLSVYCCARFLAWLYYQEYLYIHMKELTVGIVFPTVVILMYRLSPLVPLNSCLTAAACLSSACKRMFIRCVTSQWFGVTT